MFHNEMPFRIGMGLTSWQPAHCQPHLDVVSSKLRLEVLASFVSNIKHHAKRLTARPTAKPAAPKRKNAFRFQAVLDVLKEEAIVLPGEDRQAYEELRRGFFDDFKPQSLWEQQRVQILVDTAWRKKRCFALENSLFSPEYAVPPGERKAAAQLLSDQIKAMDKISLHEARLSRLWDAAWKDLQKIQADREKNELKPKLYLVH